MESRELLQTIIIESCCLFLLRERTAKLSIQDHGRDYYRISHDSENPILFSLRNRSNSLYKTNLQRVICWAYSLRDQTLGVSHFRITSLRITTPPHPEHNNINSNNLNCNNHNHEYCCCQKGISQHISQEG